MLKCPDRRVGSDGIIPDENCVVIERETKRLCGINRPSNPCDLISRKT